MKNNLFSWQHFVLLSLLLFFSGCNYKELNEEEWVSTEEKAPDPIFSVTPNSMDFGSTGNVPKTLTITSNISWNVILSHDWCHVSALSGIGTQELSVYCDDNTTNKDRNGIIRIVTSSETQEVPVFQSAALYYLSATVKNLTFNGRKDESIQFQVQSNTRWNIKSIHSLGTITPNGDDVTVTVKRNASAIERRDTIIISSIEISSLADTIYIRQTAGEDPYLSLSTEELSCANQGGELKFAISTNVEWDLSVDNNKDWCQITSATSGEGDSEIAISVAKNGANQPAREANITIRSSAGNKVVKVSQDAGEVGYLTATPNLMNISAQADILTFSIQSNLGSWTYHQPSATWCRVLNSSQTNESEYIMNVEVERNTSTEVRTTTITISSSIEPVTITINQDVLQTPGGDDNPNPHYSRKH